MVGICGLVTGVFATKTEGHKGFFHHRGTGHRDFFTTSFFNPPRSPHSNGGMTAGLSKLRGTGVSLQPGVVGWGDMSLGRKGKSFLAEMLETGGRPDRSVLAEMLETGGRPDRSPLQISCREIWDGELATGSVTDIV